MSWWSCFIKDKVNSHRQSRSMPHFPTSFPSINPDDIAAASDTPPSPHARMLSRIAWCEKHTFGRTYPELHLLQRLHQLNASLFPKDNEKDIKKALADRDVGRLAGIFKRLRRQGNSTERR